MNKLSGFIEAPLVLDLDDVGERGTSGAVSGVDARHVTSWALVVRLAVVAVADSLAVAPGRRAADELDLHGCSLSSLTMTSPSQGSQRAPQHCALW